MALHVILVVIVAIAVALAIEAERRKQVWGGVAKMVAATGYMVAAWQAGAFQSAIGVAFMVAFALSWLGDLLLIPKNKKTFLVGLGAFLFAHVAFANAFRMLGQTWWVAGAALVLFAIAFYPVLRTWLLPNVPGKMRGPVVAYIVAILLMLGLSFGAAHATGIWLLAAAATVFAVSDLFVARQRFIAPHWHNRAIGLPLYFAAQLMFVYTL